MFVQLAAGNSKLQAADNLSNPHTNHPTIRKAFIITFGSRSRFQKFTTQYNNSGF